jgi:cytosolic carboxypeptidase protein 6
MKKTSLLILILSVLFSGIAQTTKPVFQGQPPAQIVDTSSRPIEKQVKRQYSFEEDNVYFSNQFDGARLNTIERIAENSYKITITPENSPINPSPWYAFQVWSKKKKEIAVTLAYPEGTRHRYNPQISTDAKTWRTLDSAKVEEIEKGTGVGFGPEAHPKSILMRLNVSKKMLWVAAQELQNSTMVFGWMDKLAKKKKFEITEIGKSTEGRPLRMMKIGNQNAKNMIMVISRQHPPEVTGYFAMQAFIEKITDKSELSRTFLKDWAIYVVPLMNPDGVDNGHWRHNTGGIDLNRDWSAFNQPETTAVREFLKKREAETGGKFYFGIDFHSTWDDIYYPMEKAFVDTNKPGLVWNWLDNIKKSIPNYQPNIQANSKLEPTMVSRNFFAKNFKMEALVFEIGDNTSREFIKTKGEIGAIELMKLLLEK